MMKTTLLSKFAAAALTLALGTGLVLASDPPTRVPPVQEEKTASSGQKLTEESLLTTLENMGYTPRIEKSGNTTFYYIKITNRLTYEVQIALSSGKTKIWESIVLTDLPKDGTIAPSRLLKLLELNKRIGPSAFSYSKQHNLLYIEQAVDNRGVTPTLLRASIDDLIAMSNETSTFWLNVNWAEPIAAGTAQAK